MLLKYFNTFANLFIDNMGLAMYSSKGIIYGTSCIKFVTINKWILDNVPNEVIFVIVLAKSFIDFVLIFNNIVEVDILQSFPK